VRSAAVVVAVILTTFAILEDMIFVADNSCPAQL